MVSSGSHPPLTNEQVAASLEETADLLESQGANPFRVRAYRKAAGTIRGLRGSLERMFAAEGPEGLMRLPGIGRSLGQSIGHMLRTGRLPLLQRLRGEDAPERLFMTVADIGPKLAQRIHEELEIETLAELEAAAHDGRLAEVQGMGKKRLRAVRESLAGRFARQPRGVQPPSRQTDARSGGEDVPVAELLDIDQEYRRRAKQGSLPRIAPRRFNPTHEAWLPVLHTQRSDRHYTALFSNTARAHELAATRDWVVIYRDDHDDGQWTVITSRFGALGGRRVVRGREPECAAWYRDAAASDESATVSAAAAVSRREGGG
ncbi:MAG: helix-hairpin-helix domain-containing protein [Pirellulaceae bacterium]